MDWLTLGLSLALPWRNKLGVTIKTWSTFAIAEILYVGYFIHSIGFKSARTCSGIGVGADIMLINKTTHTYTHHRHFLSSTLQYL